MRAGLVRSEKITQDSDRSVGCLASSNRMAQLPLSEISIEPLFAILAVISLHMKAGVVPFFQRLMNLRSTRGTLDHVVTKTTAYL